jgi:hypothetical protein|tara:strand:- start:794 stop:2011 length:1218 start_codon:yes stop_codon:yes gene_type:complete
MSTEVKQEGSFKIKKKTPKKLVTEKEVTKVDLTKKEENAISTQATNDSDVAVKKSEDSQDSKEVVEEIRPADKTVENTEENSGNEKVTETDSPLELIEDENNKADEARVDSSAEVASTASEQKEILQENKTQELPENIDKLIKFMKETGGDIQDYARLNADYSNVDNDSLIKEFYKQTKPHLDAQDIDVILEDFSFDKEIDEPKDVRKKQIAYKEEVAKAKTFLEQTKEKYYEELKLRPSETSEQKKALDFFNRYKQEEQNKQAVRDVFIDRTNNLFADDFKGFDFKVGEKKFRYGIKDPASVANAQKDLTEFVGTFLNKNGEIADAAAYHKAVYAARNADTIANHFYEQGKTDAIKDQIAKTKNLSTTPRPTASGEVFVNGLKVKAISGLDSSKLKIQTKKFKN